ncbi:IclR family transcriptional regulator [Amycolatopsis sp. EV170708-02-1]|uniref:IclR family transcriptional regulator n=1 Tax=Amycolatopsis sp. EV170708-02-1 TaxID=2919322 RepID=UPI001F0C925D|nr:IclR family transcriptional regulator [Amycolatopsis sp. EV170708-02-1]UMO99809.1 IclR family transcriptional regulator [Amycolatopsis sp. EV170708-02-1]
MSDTAPPGTQTLARGLALIRAVAGGATDLRGLVEDTGLGRSTAHRLVQLLVSEGYLRSGRDGYALGPTLIELGFQALHGSPLPVVARPVLEELAEQLRDTVHLAVRDGDSVLYLDKLPGSRGAEMRSRIGHRMPLTRTGVGMALLLDSAPEWRELYLAETPAEPGRVRPEDLDAFLARMREYAESGVAMDLEDNEPGIRCVAAPIRDATGAIAGAISVSATRPYMPAARMRGLNRVVGRAARQVSAGLGHREP